MRLRAGAFAFAAHPSPGRITPNGWFCENAWPFAYNCARGGMYGTG